MVVFSYERGTPVNPGLFMIVFKKDLQYKLSVHLRLDGLDDGPNSTRTELAGASEAFPVIIQRLWPETTLQECAVVPRQARIQGP